MQTLLSILRATHCRSVHHHFAVDALPLVGTQPGKRLVQHLLQHNHRYLTGAKDPDTRFRDFQNHVVHVDDGYWGGAPRVAHQWYDRLQKYLSQNRFDDAAHAAGVLSHYFTDPLQPLHTAQSAVEAVLHRPIEWSVNRNYHNLFRAWRQDSERVLFRLSDRPGWLGDAILQSARFANRHYETLLNHYDLAVGRSRPAEGFDKRGNEVLSDLIGLAITGWARVLERAARDAEQRLGNPLPKASTSVAAVLATLRVPSRVWLRRIEDRRTRSKVAALVDEFHRTGKVVENLPSEVRVVGMVRSIAEREREYNAQRKQLRELHSQVVAGDPKPPPTEVEESLRIAPEITPTEAPPQILAFETPDDAIRLHVHDPLVDAPSIGPKTAARFAKLGIHQVGEFLATDPPTVASRLDVSWITSDTVHAWRCQAMLMCLLPRMLARECQLLVGAGYPTLQSIATADNSDLQRDLDTYASTNAGARHLRGAQPPTSERISGIQTDAAHALVKQKRRMANQRAHQGSPAEAA
ncbi:MAG: DUF4332 domain-containing protein [Planctomycetota bacterium]